MHISWLGGTAIRLQTKPLSEDVVVVIDPYKPEEGSYPRSLSPQIALYTRGLDGSMTLSDDPFVLASPGECETKGVLISALYGGKGDNLFFRIDVEGMSVAHLGKTNAQLSEEELEAVGDVDILFVPVGGSGCFEAEDAVKTVNAIEPRIVIPMAFHSDNDPKAAGAESFIRSLGSGATAPEKKIILKKKDLPTDETKVIVLEKE